MHVAVLDEEFPFPLTSGKRIRTFSLITRLADTHRITYIAHRNADSEELASATNALRDHGITTVPVDYKIPLKAGLGFYGRLLGNLFSPLPYSVQSHASRAMQTAMDRLQGDDPPDLWHCEWSPYAEAMRGREGRFVVMAHNVEAVIWQRLAEAERNPAKRWFMRRQWRKFERFERWAYSAATRAVAVSAEDARRMQAMAPDGHMDVVDNGVDTLYFTPDPTTPRDPFQMLFLGSLDWRPNQDGVQFLLDEVYPKVRLIEPRATISIVGRKPPAWMVDRAKQPGVSLHADVPDVRPFVHRAGLLAVTLRAGGGSRLKILEALAAGLPVLSTAVGMEGLRLTPSEHLETADNVDALAQKAVAIMRDPSSAARQAERGRARVLAEYDWRGLAERLGEVWERASVAP